MRLTLKGDEFSLLKEIRESQGIQLKETNSNKYRLSKEEYDKIIMHREAKPKPKKKRKQNTRTTKPYDISAFDEKGNLMSFEEWSKKHDLIFPPGTTFKLITHTGRPFYNVTLPKGSDKAMNLHKLQDAINSLTDDVKPHQRVIKRTKKQNGLHVYFSDKHIGAHTEADSIYSNDYNSDVLMQRVDTAVQKIIEISKRMVIDTLFVADLGDSLDGFNGFTTRGGHKLSQNMTNEEAFELYLKAHKHIVDECILNNTANNYVFYFAVNDNHSGVFGYMAARALKEYINLKYPFAEMIIEERFIGQYKYGNHTFLLTHGKDKKHMKFGFPKLLNEKTELFLKDYISKHNVTGKVHVIKGDLHQDSVDFCNAFRYRNVLSLYGASGWIHHNFGYNHSGVSYEIIGKFSDDEPYESRWFIK